MAGVRNRTIALLIVGLVLSAGCSPQAKPAPPAAQLGTDAPEEATPTPTAVPTESEAPDPYAIPENPEDIDKAYVERVLVALDAGVVAATREVARSKKVTPAVADALRPTHLASARDGYLAAFRQALAQPGGLPFRRNPKLVEIESVDRIVTARPSCIFAAVTQDSSGLLTRPIEPFQVYYHLVPKQDPRPTKANPTPWMVAADSEPPKNGKEFEDPCDPS